MLWKQIIFISLSAKDHKIDENFLFAVDSLIMHLNKLLQSDYVFQDPTE